MLRYQLSFVAAALWLTASGTPLADEVARQVHVATEGAFLPWNFTRPDGSVDGFEVELANELCRRANLTCTITAEGFDGLIPSLTSGKIDAIMAAMSITPKRQEVIDFSSVYAVTEQGFATMKGGSLESIPDDGKVFYLDTDEAASLAEIEKLTPLLKGSTIGVQGGAIADQFMSRYFVENVQLRKYKSTEQHDLDLVGGRLDAIFTSSVYLATASKKPGNENMVMVGPRFRGGLLGSGVGVGMRKGEDALKAAFDAAIKAAQGDGTITRLSMKWFGIDIGPQ
jgi:octopine/nopaline transport system substrate-binding protein